MAALMPAHAAPASSPATQPIDVLDYFLQKNDVGDNWTIGGKDVRPDKDPDGTDRPTLILNKFSSSTSYEVYKVTPTELQLRYEVMRPNPNGGPRNWVRRFEGLDAARDSKQGVLWMPRMVVPGQTEFLAREMKDRYIFDPQTESYKLDATGSSRDGVIHGSLVWACVNWAQNNRTGFELNPVLRLVSQWQREGKIFECYDYARGKGMVNWRWLERISTLKPIAGDTTGHLFHCENGAVCVDSAGDAEHPPIVFVSDLAKGVMGKPLQVISFTSHWNRDLGPQWYLIYRDLAQERLLERKDERIEHDFTLPEWRAKPGATIADLPGVNTGN